MEFKSVDAAVAIDIFLLLLIGIGPKIACMRQAPVPHHPRRVMRQRPIRPDAFWVAVQIGSSIDSHRRIRSGLPRRGNQPK